MNNDCVLCAHTRMCVCVCVRVCVYVNNVFVLCVYMSIGIILL